MEVPEQSRPEVLRDTVKYCKEKAEILQGLSSSFLVWSGADNVRNGCNKYTTSSCVLTPQQPLPYLQGCKYYQAMSNLPHVCTNL